MRKTISLPLFLIILAGLLGAIVFDLPQKGLGQLLQYSLNRNTKALFKDSLRVEKVRLEKNLEIQIDHLHGKLQTEGGPLPFQIKSINSEGPVTDFFSQEGLVLNFKEARTADSKYGGIHGSYRFRGGREGFFEIKAEVQGLGLEELEPLNPENLRGSSGEIKGEITIRQGAKGVFLRANLRIDEPGGRLQARFLDLLKPYLPQMGVKEKVEQILAAGGGVDFRIASLEMELVESEKMKVLLHLAIPDYNLDLHFNIEVRVDEKNAFLQLAELGGLIGKAP